jgi:hypothetical protein
MIWHTFDVMHHEKNLAVNVMKTILGEKDTKKVCPDLETLGVRSTLWMKPHPTQEGETIMLHAPWVMPSYERLAFLDTIV